MRIQIRFDSATTRQVRDLSVALHRAGLPTNQVTVGVEGPECWGGDSPLLTPDQFARVAAHLIKCNDDIVADVLDRVMAEQ